MLFDTYISWGESVYGNILIGCSKTMIIYDEGSRDHWLVKVGRIVCADILRTGCMNFEHICVLRVVST